MTLFLPDMLRPDDYADKDIQDRERVDTLLYGSALAGAAG